MSDPRSILYIESGNQGGGSFGSLCQLIRGLDRTRFYPIVVFLVPNKFTAILDEMGVENHVLPDRYYPEDFTVRSKQKMLGWRRWAFRDHPRWTVPLTWWHHGRLIRRLRQLIGDRNVQLLHLNNTVYRNFFGVLLARLCGIPCVSHLRSTNSGDFNQVMRSYAERYVSLHVAVSNDTRQYWIGQGLPSDRIRTIYNGIAPPMVTTRNIRSEFGIEERFKHVIGVVAMLVGFKGHEFLFRAFAKVAAVRPDVLLLVVGDGPLRSKLESQVETLGLAGRVIFTGHQDNALGIISGLDLMIVPSQAEPLGRVILEAMSCRTPVVATNTGGSPEMIEHGKNGHLVPYDDDVAMYDAICELLGNEAKRTEMADAASATVKDRFALDRHVTQIEDIYQGLLCR